MNLLLLHPEDRIETNVDRVRITGRRLEHILEVHRAVVGDQLRVGWLDGQLGSGRIESLDKAQAVLRVSCSEAPAAKIGVRVAVAMPRPPMLRRILHTATSMGVPALAFFQSRRVEKSYWSSPHCKPAAMLNQVHLGLEQARDTIPPHIETHLRFRPFVEDALRTFAGDTTLLVADVEGETEISELRGTPVTVVVGPEGGLIDFELDLLASVGARRVSLGARPYRVDTAVVALVAALQ